MSDKVYSVAPARLTESNDSLGQALHDYKCSQNEQAKGKTAKVTPGAFAHLMEKHHARSHARTSIRLLAAATLLGGLGLGRQLWMSDADNESSVSSLPLIAAEETFDLGSDAALDAVAQADISARDAVADSKPTEIPSASTPSAAMNEGSTKPESIGSITKHPAATSKALSGTTPNTTKSTSSLEQRSSSPSSTVVVEESSFSENCGDLSASKNYEAALRCYEKQSQSSGIRAELAFLELARLKEYQKGDLAGALSSIDAYETRFPAGTLHPEAKLKRIRLLVRLGRNQEARDAIAQASRTMPEKALSLRELAVDLSVAEGKCQEANELARQIPAERANQAWKTAHLGECLTSSSSQ